MTIIEISRLDTPTLHRLLQRALDRADSIREQLDRRAERALEETTPISNEFAAIRALTPPVEQEDSVAIIRALRDE